MSKTVNSFVGILAITWCINAVASIDATTSLFISEHSLVAASEVDTIGSAQDYAPWTEQIDVNTPASNQSFNGWSYHFLDDSTPLFAIDETSYSAHNISLKVDINNEMSGMEHVSGWQKDFIVDLPPEQQHLLIRMKVNDSNAGLANWRSQIAVQYREVGQSNWSAATYGEATQHRMWTDLITLVSFPTNSHMTRYEIRVMPTVTGYGDGTVSFDDLEIWRACSGDECLPTLNVADLEPCINGQTRSLISLQPEFGTPSDQRAGLQSQFDSVHEQCIAYELSADYLIDTVGKGLYAITLPDRSDFIVLGTGSITLAPTSTTDNISSDYRGILAISGDPDRAEFVDFTIDHNAQHRLLESYDVKDALIPADVRSSIASYASATGFGDLLYQGLTIKNADSVVSIYNNRYYSAPTDILGRAESVIVNQVTWLNGTTHGVDYDQSFVNIDTDYGEITHSSVVGESWLHAPRTAFEPHFRSGFIKHNYVEKTQVGFNLAGISRGGKANDIVLSDNEMHVSRSGILIWSEGIAPTHAPLGLDGAKVDNNLVYMYPHEFPYYNPTAPSVRVGTGIYFYSGSKFNGANRIEITNNTIEYMNGSFSYLQQNNSKYAGAIGGYNFNYSNDTGNVPDKAALETVVIDGNTIKQCEAAAIYFYLGEISDLTITNNTFDNCGLFEQDGSQSWYTLNFIVYINNTLLGQTDIRDNYYIHDEFNSDLYDIYVRDRGTNTTLIAIRNTNL
ncbi:hypothetical protein [Echinimonas agarilytica]|uniref:Right handed beta helix region n=1 Tax=Echinimonas agarilytica TaxID=1215918 RepID=A0AA41W643_9GAMM|nr:hypothetical protein [Echinimonas agarilytica]MCM2679386.1 hypothetical protein [Echinimonas agarilytica]